MKYTSNYPYSEASCLISSTNLLLSLSFFKRDFICFSIKYNHVYFFKYNLKKKEHSSKLKYNFSFAFWFLFSHSSSFFEKVNLGIN